MGQKTMLNSELIAPCGMNCGICMAYLREKNRCPGCRGEDKNKSKTCLNCKIKNCEGLKKNNLKYCFSCALYPCARIKHIDMRYRTKYDMSMIENLENIKKIGIRQFVRNEKIRWACTKCGSTINVHRKLCSNCGEKKE